MNQAEPDRLKSSKDLADKIRKDKRTSLINSKRKTTSITGSITRKQHKQIGSGVATPKVQNGDSRSDHSGSKSVVNQLSNLGFMKPAELVVVEEQTEQKDQSRVNVIGNVEDQQDEYFVYDEGE